MNELTLSLWIFAVLAMMTVVVWSCANDARRRGKSPWAVGLLVLIFFPLGLLLWLIFRPEPPPQFDLEQHRIQ